MQTNLEIGKRDLFRRCDGNIDTIDGKGCQLDIPTYLLWHVQLPICNAYHSADPYIRDPLSPFSRSDGHEKVCSQLTRYRIANLSPTLHVGFTRLDH